METQTQSLGFFDQLIYSVQPAKYKELMEQSARKVLSYVLILSLCLGIMQFVIPMAGWFVSFGGLDNLFLEVLPAIELQDGRLSVENKIEIGADSTTYVLIDTEKVSVQESDLNPEKYISEILVAEENMIISSSGVGVAELCFADFGDITLDNAGLKALKPFVYVLLIISFLTQSVTQIFGFLSWGVLMALCCWGPFRLRGTENIKYTKILTLAIYAQTAFKLVTAFNACVNWITDAYILYYAGMIASMFLLMSGLRKMEERLHE